MIYAPARSAGLGRLAENATQGRFAFARRPFGFDSQVKTPPLGGAFV